MKRKLIHLVSSALSVQAQGNRWPACLLALVLVGAVPSFAKTLMVTNTNDSGPGSLRDAVATANASDRIAFSVTGTISLTGGSLTLDKNVTIKGPGATELAINGNGESPVLIIGSQNPSIIIAISGLTIQRGGVGVTANIGAGIINYGTLRVVDSTVSNNFNGPGGVGGILNDGMLTLVNSTVSGNSSIEGVGGILNNGTLTLMNSMVSDNSVFSGDGGGINNAGTVTLINSTVSDNGTERGAGIFNRGSGTLTLTNSTVSGNSTSVFGTGTGGGIYNESGTVTMTNSTITDNSGGDGGGGIYNESGTLSVIDSTIASNSAADQGGGVYNAGVFTVKNTLIANNVTGREDGTGNCDISGGTVTSLGYNVSDDGSCSSFLTATGDENNVIPGAGLDPKGLQNNGGPTQTIALLPGSPAVDHIPVPDCTDAQDRKITIDQRHVRRPQGSACDTGAFELVQAVPFASFKALLALQTGERSGFGLTSSFTLGSASNGIAPLTEPVTLQIAQYTVDIPAGSFHQLWNSLSAPYVYEGTINGTKLVVGFIPLGGRNYQFNAIGSPLAWANVKNPVTISLTVGNDTGNASVKAFIDRH